MSGERTARKTILASFRGSTKATTFGGGSLLGRKLPCG